MKKRFWVTLLALVLVTLFMVSCVKVTPSPTVAPETNPIAQADGVVTFTWGAVADAGSYDVEIDLVAPAAGERLVLGVNQGVQSGETFVVQIAGTYRWRVRARNAGGVGPWSEWEEFEGIPFAADAIRLELSSNVIYECGTVTATITALDDDVDKFRLLGRRSDDDDYTYQTNAINFGPDRMHVLVLTKADLNGLSASARASSNNNDDELEQEWILNAQAEGDAAKFDEEPLTIKNIYLTPEVTVKMGATGQPVLQGNYVCVESVPASAVYTVNINFTDDASLNALISEYSWSLSVSEGTVTSGSGTGTTAMSQDVQVDFATECSKIATLTVNGTKCGDESFTFTDTIGFTLDGLAPEATINTVLPAPTTTTATVTVIATDTKSLCDATITFFVEKLDELGAQIDGWTQTVKWGDTTIAFGSGDGAVTGSATYAGTVGNPGEYGELTTLMATFVLNLGTLDGASLTTSAAFIDCCDLCWEDICGDPERNVTEVETDPAFYDNWLYSIMDANIDFIPYGDVPLWTITTNSTDLTGNSTFTFADAFLEESTVTLTDDNSVLDDATWVVTTGSVIKECTGVPLKLTDMGTLTLIATEATEGTVVITYTATDTNGNVKTTTREVYVDTLAGSMTDLQAIVDFDGVVGDNYAQFALRQTDLDQDVEVLGATVTVTPTGTSQGRFLPVYYEADEIDFIGTFWQIELDKSPSMDAGDGITVEAQVEDKFGSKGTTTMTGVAITN